MLATTKYITDPRSANTRYFSRAMVIICSVFSASAKRSAITPEVTFKHSEHREVLNILYKKIYIEDLRAPNVKINQYFEPFSYRKLANIYVVILRLVYFKNDCLL